MAAGKKKKKPAANPARGFATTSIPSKPKPAQTDEEELDQPQPTVQEPYASPTPNHSEGGSSVPASNFQDMQPDEFETYLEDAELQTLLDTNSPRCKSDSARQVSRLQVELRQLRPQSHQLSTFSWLDDAQVDKVLLNPVAPHPTPSNFDPLKNGDHKMVLDLWVLQRVLSALALPRIDEALKFVLDLALRHPLATDPAYIWGLIEALDWLATHVPLNELPKYQTMSLTASESNNAKPSQRLSAQTRTETDAAHDSEGAPSRHPPTISRTDEKAETRPPSVSSNDAQSSSMTEASSEESSDDGLNDPMYLIEKHVKLRTRLWKRENRGSCLQNSSRNDSKSQKQRSKLSKIEQDILFDKKEANEFWKPVLIRLEAQENLKRRAAKKAHVKTSTSDSQPEMNQETADATSSDDDEDANSDMFGATFTTSTDVNDDQPRPLASSIRVVDFGNPIGTKPRLLLEQTCRTIDPGFTLKFTALQQSSHSNRHRLDLFWTSDRGCDRFAVQAALDEATITVQSQSWILEMDKTAAASNEQSFSYAATVMLFLVSSLDGQDGQISLRLAGAWRELVVRLSERRREFINAHDKLELREMRRLVYDSTENLENNQKQNGLKFPEAKGELADLPVRQRPTDNDVFSPQRAHQEWSSRLSSPAFKRMLTAREQLPIFSQKDHILEQISSNTVTIICAETGSGKSTQCGSFLLERELSSGRDCRILITQPRRISAISLARRVSQELGEPPNAIGTLRSLVGYSIRLESKTSPATRLTFATTGVLLRMLESSPLLDQLDYLVLDEVHERSLETDLLLIALRVLLKKRSTLKVILMSATVNAEMFSAYFQGAPILNIPGRTFPVQVEYLEDAIEATNDISDDAQPSSLESEEADVDGDDDEQPAKQISAKACDLKGYSSSTRKRLASMDQYRIDYGLIAKLATAIATKEAYSKYSSAILIFMPGMAEIRRLHRILLNTKIFARGWHVHLLHSSFSTEELERAFSVPPPGQRKIVIATNIAETGITIPDVTAVIDTCKEKIMRYNERRQLSKLSEAFISRSSAKQRRGRAARVREGLCFHLVTKHYFENFLQEESQPEILRLGLQDPILRIKVWNFGSAEETLSQAITPPSRKNVIRAVERLREAGALTGSEQLTSLGEQVARLPLDVSLAKLAILGATFRCLDPVLAIISILTSKSPFVNEMAAKSNFSRANSDLLSALSAYEGWKRAKSKGSAFEFCRKNWLNEHTLSQVEEQKVQLLVYLVDGGQIGLSHEERHALNRARVTNFQRKDMYEMPQRYNSGVPDDLLLALISMSFYPRILVKEGKGWRNVYTNQQVALAKRSVNDGNLKSVKWLSFSEAMQARPGSLNVFETSRVPESALALLLGQAEMKIFSGVLSIDSGKIRLAVGNWKQAIAIKRLRTALSALLDHCHRRPGKPLSDSDQRWLDLFLGMMVTKEAEIG